MIKEVLLLEIDDMRPQSYGKGLREGGKPWGGKEMGAAMLDVESLSQMRVEARDCRRRILFNQIVRKTWRWKSLIYI
jgi:hypothetical protein